MSLERYSRATRSTNLKSSDYTELDIDWLTAAGALQVPNELNPTPDPLPPQVARLLSGDNNAFWTVVETVENRLSGGGKRKSIQMGKEVQSALWWFLAPACRDCVKGYRPIPDTNRLADEPCPTCSGSGLTKHEYATQNYADTLRALDVAAAACIHAIRKKVA